MKLFSVLLLIFTLVGSGSNRAFGAANGFEIFGGKYAELATVTTSIVATGSATVTIVNPSNRPGRSTVTVDGSISANGNIVPLRTKLVLKGRKVQAGSFLFGLRATKIATRVAHSTRRAGKVRVRLFAAGGATLGGDPVSGRMTYVFQLVNHTLKIVGRGFVKIGDGVPQPLLIVLEAPPTT